VDPQQKNANHFLKKADKMEWTGGRSSSGAVTVYLNVYDLVPNNWGHSFGLGLYHTGATHAWS
jgi:hypothetical protein